MTENNSLLYFFPLVNHIKASFRESLGYLCTLAVFAGNHNMLLK